MRDMPLSEIFREAAPTSAALVAEMNEQGYLNDLGRTLALGAVPFGKVLVFGRRSSSRASPGWGRTEEAKALGPSSTPR